MLQETDKTDRHIDETVRNCLTRTSLTNEMGQTVPSMHMGS